MEDVIEPPSSQAGTIRTGNGDKEEKRSQNLKTLGDHASTKSVGYHGKTIALPEDKTTRVEAWAQKLLKVDTTIQENLECFVGTLISTTPAVEQGSLHYRALQTALNISLKQGMNSKKSVRISHPHIMRDL